MDLQKIMLVVVTALACPLCLPIVIDELEVEPYEPNRETAYIKPKLR